MATRKHLSQRDTIEKFVEALQALPHVDAQPPIWDYSGVSDRKIDARIDVKVDNKRYTLLVEFKKSVYPRDVRETLWTISQLKNYPQPPDHSGIIVPILAAESLSPGAKEVLKGKNVGYFDTGGSLFIPARGAYFYIEKPPPKTLAKSVRVLFQGKRSQVLHALLHERHRWFGVTELAELAKVSPATVSETLTALERFDWLASRGQGPSKERQLAEPSALLDEWRKQVLVARPPLYRRYYVPATDSETLTKRIAQVCERRSLEYVITQEVAAQHYAPFLSTISRVSCRLIPGRVAHAMVSELEAHVVSEGANLLVIETKSPGDFLFKERVGSIWLASPVQVYLDLLWSGGRAPEMADHLRRERIGF